MKDILNIDIDFEKCVLELRTEELEEEIPFSEIKTGKENGNQILEFVENGQSSVLIINKDGVVIDYFWSE